MKLYIPPQRLIDLGLVLQYDSELQEIQNKALLSFYQRLLINQERAKLLSGDENNNQPDDLETIIKAVLNEINKQNWQPKQSIKYG